MLRFLLLLLTFISFSCENARKSDEEFPLKASPDWITYEGRIPLTDNDNLYMELAMNAGAPGEGVYVLNEYLESEEGDQIAGTFKGAYTSFPSEGGGIDIHFQNSSYEKGFKRSYRSPDGKRIREEDYRVRDLVLTKQGDHKLIALDNSNEPITLEDDYNLSKRTSIVFTVEGQFAHVGDSSVFYEMNTGQSWSVSKQGKYDLAIRQYHQLANAKNEGVYLKGTGFSIQQERRNGVLKDFLVFKKILSMTSAPSAN
jgi:hypothetical protein